MNGNNHFTKINVSRQVNTVHFHFELLRRFFVFFEIFVDLSLDFLKLDLQVSPQKIAYRFKREKTTCSFPLSIRHIIFLQIEFWRVFEPENQRSALRNLRCYLKRLLFIAFSHSELSKFRFFFLKIKNFSFFLSLEALVDSDRIWTLP